MYTNLSQLLRITFGIMLAALLFVPFGVFYSRAEPYLIGFLFGFSLPVGYVSLLCGILLIFYPKLAFSKRISLESFMVSIGLSLILAFLVFPPKLLINLFTGSNFSANQIDIDFPMGNAAVWGLSLLSISSGLSIKLAKRTSKKES